MNNENVPMIKEFFADKGMSQIYSRGLEYAFVSKDGKQCHPFVLCKDFLHDAVWAVVNNTKMSIHGFSYDVKTNPPLDMDNIRLAIRLKGKSDELKSKIENTLKLINEVEKDLGFARSKLYYGGEFNKDTVWVFVGSKRWLLASPLVSYYSLLVRAGLEYTGKNYKEFLSGEKFFGAHDKSYLNRSKKVWEALDKETVRKMFSNKREKNYCPRLPRGVLHNLGIVNFATRALPAALSNVWTKEI